MLFHVEGQGTLKKQVIIKTSQCPQKGQSFKPSALGEALLNCSKVILPCYVINVISRQYTNSIKLKAYRGTKL